MANSRPVSCPSFSCRSLAVRLLLLGGLAGVTLSAPRPAGDLTVVACGAGGSSGALSISYRCSKKAPAGASASLGVPVSLGVGDSLPMTIENVSDQSMQDDEIRYWGSSASVLRGQPEHARGSVPLQRAGSTAYVGEPRLSALKGSSVGTYRLSTSW